MKMVSISRQARIDLDNIVIGLLRWKKVKLTVNEAMQYVDDIADICYHLGNVNYYFKATYNDHKQFGSYICSYKRNNNTTWFII
ncbi:MAG: hypothetical protein LBV75_06600, partial [Paludibacter sp.]|nr:hypothetical protein [Paludibacter sp.]